MFFTCKSSITIWLWFLASVVVALWVTVQG